MESVNCQREIGENSRWKIEMIPEKRREKEKNDVRTVMREVDP